MGAFDLERFIERCRDAIALADATGAVREIVAKAVQDQGAIVAALGERGIRKPPR